ncbi:MAG: hypothetical protein HOH33_09900 [Verrucomicrobia bacterium]|nr:hypothetical protein [Verrucomicrobiota bacterium]
MKNWCSTFAFLIIIGAATGCSIKHPVMKDYPQYLEKHGKEGNLPTTELKSNYSIEGKTQTHRYEFRAATVGYAHLWIVEFGEILDETLNAPYVQSSFGELTKASAEIEGLGSNIKFTLNNYEFKNYRAYVSMNIILLNDGKELLNKNYNSEGASKGGQMWIAGPFGMKNATLDSTKIAIDKILTQFIKDIPKT